MNPGGAVKSDPRRALPGVDRVVRALESADGSAPLWALREAARDVLEAERDRLAGAAPEPAQAAPEADLIARARVRAHDLARSHPQRVINATGILLHTNL